MEIRPFVPSDAPALTRLLHSAYAELGAQGLNFTAVDQDDTVTLRRAMGGQTWVAEDEGVLAGAITISWPPEAGMRALSPHARVPDRAWLNQLAVHPGRRGSGLATRLRDTGCAWCRARGASSIGLDTARPATRLVALYAHWGFETVDVVQWPGKTYESVVMVRALRPPSDA